MARPRLACVGVDGPIERASAEDASSLAFSMIWRWRPSSFARIGTRSSGMGLLSYTTRHTQHTHSNINRKSGATHLEALAELDEVCHALVHVALHERLALLSQTLLLVLHKVAERRERVRRRLRALAVRRRRRRLARRRACAGGGKSRAVGPVQRELGHSGVLLLVAVRVRRARGGVGRRHGDANGEVLSGSRGRRDGWEARAARAWRNVRVLPTDDGAVSM